MVLIGDEVQQQWPQNPELDTPFHIIHLSQIMK